MAYKSLTTDLINWSYLSLCPSLHCKSFLLPLCVVVNVEYLLWAVNMTRYIFMSEFVPAQKLTPVCLVSVFGTYINNTIIFESAKISIRTMQMQQEAADNPLVAWVLSICPSLHHLLSGLKFQICYMKGNVTFDKCWLWLP